MELVLISELFNKLILTQMIMGCYIIIGICACKPKFDLRGFKFNFTNPMGWVLLIISIAYLFIVGQTMLDHRVWLVG